MRWYILKKIRVVVSLVFFLLTVFLFIDFAALFPAGLINGILYFQFIPSLLNFLTLVSLAAAGFVFVLVLTLLFGRIYCSTICPLGTLQDIIIRLNRWFGTKKRFRFQKPFRILHFFILALVILPLFFRNIFLLGLLDPYSLSGKIFTNFFRPVYYGLNNVLNYLLNAMDIYRLYPVTVYRLSIPAVIFVALFSVMIVLLAVYRGRWFCNSICPAGAILRLASKVSLFRITIDRENCTACGLCLRDCKAGCIDIKNREIDFERCVACFDCFRACPEEGIKYNVQGIRFKIQNGVTPSLDSGISRSIPALLSEKNEKFSASSRLRGDKTRRNFLKTIVFGTATVAGATVSKKVFASEETASSEWPVTPPGSVSLWHYREKCTACHLCVSTCPTKVLQPAFLEFGMAGLFQPRMDFHTNFCNYECTLCSETCPTGALLPLTVGQKKVLQTGISKFIKNICVVVEKKTACGACSEHCPTKAVEMIPYLGNLKIPKVDEKICIGCGACEYACPTRPLRAIYVESNLYHRKAFPPKKKIEGQERKVFSPEDDFPF